MVLLICVTMNNKTVIL